MLHCRERSEHHCRYQRRRVACRAFQSKLQKLVTLPGTTSLPHCTIVALRESHHYPLRNPTRPSPSEVTPSGPAASYRLGTTGHSELSLYTHRPYRASGSIRVPRHYPGWRAVKRPRLYDLGTFWLLKRGFWALRPQNKIADQEHPPKSGG